MKIKNLKTGYRVYDARTGEKLVFSRLLKPSRHSTRQNATCKRPGVVGMPGVVIIDIAHLTIRPRQRYPLTSEAPVS